MLWATNAFEVKGLPYVQHPETLVNYALKIASTNAISEWGLNLGGTQVLVNAPKGKAKDKSITCKTNPKRITSAILILIP